MSEVIKVNYLNNNSTTKIYVFVGMTLSTDVNTLNQLFISDQNNTIFKSIFNEVELENIRANNIPVEFVNETIHYDDNIQSIKEKITLVDDITVSLDEIYLFGLFNHQNNPSLIFKTLTNNGKLELTRNRLLQYLININYSDIDSIPVKETYTYNDIVSLNLVKYTTIEQSITQKFTAVNNTYQHIVNPFNAFYIEEFLSRNANDIITTLNSNLLLSNGMVNDNTIYLCKASDVLEYAINSQLSQTDFLNIYFPFISKRGINSLQELTDSQTILLENDKQHITEDVLQNFKKVDLFYNIDNNGVELPVNSSGIRYIKFSIHPLTTLPTIIGKHIQIGSCWYENYTFIKI